MGLTRPPGDAVRNETAPAALQVDTWLPYLHVVAAQDSQAKTPDKYRVPRWTLQKVAAQSFPLAINYDFDYTGQPGPQRTTPYGRRAAEKQQGPLADQATGYLARAFTNKDVDHFLEQARNASIVHTFGHGGNPDLLTYYVTFWTGSVWSLLSESSERGLTLPGVVWRRIRDPANQSVFPGAQLVVFVGCGTARKPKGQPGPNAPAGWGSPADGAKAMGARTVVGFYRTIMSSNASAPRQRDRYLGAEEWDEVFWEQMRRGEPVVEAVRRARNQPRMHQSLQSAVILGDSGLTLHPAVGRGAGAGGN